MGHSQIEQRLREANATTNSFIRIYSDRKTEKEGELNGLGFAAKDNYCVEGFPTSNGIKPAFIEQADETAEIISILESCGARLLASTNLDPGAVGSSGENPFYGDVHRLNGEPFPFGSSSGSAVAVADSLVDFALATDMNGSVRLPGAGAKLISVLFSPESLSRSGLLHYHAQFDLIGVFAKSFSTLQKVIRALLNPLEIEGDTNRAQRLVVPNEHSLLSANHDDAENCRLIAERLEHEPTLR